MKQKSDPFSNKRLLSGVSLRCTSAGGEYRKHLLELFKANLIGYYGVVIICLFLDLSESSTWEGLNTVLTAQSRKNGKSGKSLTF